MPQRFIGGLRLYPPGTTTARLWRGFNATMPLAELLVDEGSVVLRLRGGFLRRVARLFALWTDIEWEAPRDEVTAGEFSRGPLARGVELRAPGRPPAIFWCGDQTRRAVLALLPEVVATL